MGLFLSSRFLVCCRFFVRSGKAVPCPVACDQVRGARGRRQGTETLAKLGGLPPRERLNKGMTHEKWNRNFFSQRQGGRLRAVLGRTGLSVRRTGAVRALYFPGQRNRCRRAMNRLASAQFTSRR